MSYTDPERESVVPHAVNQTTIAGGRITLYQRDDVKNAVWHCRMRLPGISGYIRRSTDTSVLKEAEEKALQILGELTQKQAHNLPIKKKTFSEIATSYLKDAQTRLDEGRNSQGRYNLILGTLKRYLSPYFGKRDVSQLTKKDLMEYRAWRQAYWITGPGSQKPPRKARYKVRPSVQRKRDAKPKAPRKPPTQATLKQEWTVLRGVLIHGMEMNAVPQQIMPLLKHEKATVARRPGLTREEYKHLYQVMRKWPKKDKNPRVQAERSLLRDYVLIMVNSGLRKGEARYLKWRDVNPYIRDGNEWITLNVRGKTGDRLVVCQPGIERYFNRIKKRKHHLDPNDYVFCHSDGEAIQEWVGFDTLMEEANLSHDTHGKKRTIYTLRHTYATFRLQNGTNVYWLKKNMGTSVTMIERHYGQTNVLIGIEHETARRWTKPSKVGDQNDQAVVEETKKLFEETKKVMEEVKQAADLIKNAVGVKDLSIDEIVPIGAFDATPVDEDDDFETEAEEDGNDTI